MNQELKKLNKFNFLQECILKDIKWNDLFIDVDLIFNNIWSSTGKIRDDIEQEKLLTLKFKFVHEFKFSGGLNNEIFLHSDLANWGLNEISILQVEENSTLLNKYNEYKNELSHVSILWEGNRKIDLIFRQLKIVQT